MFNDSRPVHLATTGDSTLGQESQAARQRVNERCLFVCFSLFCLLISLSKQRELVKLQAIFGVYHSNKAHGRFDIITDVSSYKGKLNLKVSQDH